MHRETVTVALLLREERGLKLCEGEQRRERLNVALLLREERGLKLQLGYQERPALVFSKAEGRASLAIRFLYESGERRFQP